MVHVFQGVNFLPYFYQKILTINNTDTLILTFENTVEKDLNTLLKRRKCCLPTFSPFQQGILSYQGEISISAVFFCDKQMLSIWSSSKFCLLGKSSGGF